MLHARPLNPTPALPLSHFDTALPFCPSTCFMMFEKHIRRSHTSFSHTLHAPNHQHHPSLHRSRRCTSAAAPQQQMSWTRHAHTEAPSAAQPPASSTLSGWYQHGAAWSPIFQSHRQHWQQHLQRWQRRRGVGLRVHGAAMRRLDNKGEHRRVCCLAKVAALVGLAIFLSWQACMCDMQCDLGFIA